MKSFSITIEILVTRLNRTYMLAQFGVNNKHLTIGSVNNKHLTILI
jgi:hypothetical protein